MRLRKEVLAPWAIDLLLVYVAWWGAFWLRFNLEIPDLFAELALASGFWILLGYTVGLGAARVYRQVWRYTGLAELRQLAWGVLLAKIGRAHV